MECAPDAMDCNSSPSPRWNVFRDLDLLASGRSWEAVALALACAALALGLAGILVAVVHIQFVKNRSVIPF